MDHSRRYRIYNLLNDYLVCKIFILRLCMLIHRYGPREGRGGVAIGSAGESRKSLIPTGEDYCTRRECGTVVSDTH